MIRICVTSVVALIVGSSCAAGLTSQQGTVATHVRGHVDASATRLSQFGALALTYREILDLASRDARSVDAIDLWSGRARLQDGRCMALRRNPASLELVGADLYETPNDCAALSAHTDNIATPCNSGRFTSSTGLWRIGCRRSKANRTVIFAIHGQSQPISLATIDQELLAVSAIGIHDRVQVRTMGLGSTGKTILSHYLWNPADAKPE